MKSSALPLPHRKGGEFDSNLRHQLRPVAELPGAEDAGFRIPGILIGAALRPGAAGREKPSLRPDTCGGSRGRSGQLPREVRAQIISMWVRRYSKEVTREAASVEPLIEINRTIMQGLQGAP